MKLSLFILIAIFQLSTKVLPKPPQGGIGDGCIYRVRPRASKPKATTTYYAKPLHPPVKQPSKPPKPKAEVFKIITQSQPASNTPAPKQEQILKIIHLSKHGSSSGGDKSVKILKRPKDSHNGNWSV